MRIGLIGTGAVGTLHAEAAASLKGVMLAAVCSRSAEEAAGVAAPHGAAVYLDYRDLLDHSGLDAVVVSTPHALHTQMVLDAALAGLHVLVEKPMATTVEDCDAMTKACDTAGVALAVGHIQHFLPDKVAARDAVLSGQVGDIILVHDDRSTDYRPNTRPDWFFDTAQAGGGAMMNIGGHCIDRSSWLVDAMPARVSAVTWSRFDVRVETDGVARVTMDSGVEAVLTVTSTAPRLIDEVLVVGERGTVAADPRRGAQVRVRDDVRQLHAPSPSDIPGAFRDQLLAFTRLVQDGTAFPVTTALSRAVVAAVRAIYRSSAMREPVAVDGVSPPTPGRLPSMTPAVPNGTR